MRKGNKYCLLFFGILFSNVILAGPPYDTDDPDPVLFHHWEAYVSAHSTLFNKNWSGTAPHFELNYGVIPNMQLHIIAPLSYSYNSTHENKYGYGDTEIGIKYRFVKEKKYVPEIGTFIVAELPSGDRKEGLGTGSTQIFIPVWIQKTIGKITAYGGYGQWLQSKTYNANNRFMGIQAQYQITSHFSFGSELYRNVNGNFKDTRFNVGCILDINKMNHVLFSAGKSLDRSGSNEFYFGYQFTCGNGDLSFRK